MRHLRGLDMIEFVSDVKFLIEGKEVKIVE